MNWILTLKHWQVFIVLVIGTFMTEFKVEGDPTLTVVIIVTGGTIYFAWVLLVGHALYQLLPPKIELNYNLFVINAFVWLAGYVAVLIISDGVGMTFTGWAALPMFYVFYAFLHYLMFPARILKSIEKGKKADVSECLGDFFLIVFLPIGIWFLQPRINKVAMEEGQVE